MKSSPGRREGRTRPAPGADGHKWKERPGRAFTSQMCVCDMVISGRWGGGGSEVEARAP